MWDEIDENTYNNFLKENRVEKIEEQRQKEAQLDNEGPHWVLLIVLLFFAEVYVCRLLLNIN